MSLEKNSVKTSAKKGDELKRGVSPPDDELKRGDTPKVKRVMTEKQKENLAKGRLKAHERMRSIKADKEELARYKKQDKPIKSVDSDDDENIPIKKKPVMKSPVVSDEEGENTPIKIKKKSVEEPHRVIEKHYYHEAPAKEVVIEKPPPPPPPPPVAKTKKKISFR